MSSYYDDASLMLLASGGAQKDGKVYSVKPTDGSGDFTFTRGSNLSATRVNASQLIEKGRENILLQSNSFDTTWIQSNVSVTSGQNGYDGTNDAWLLNKTNTGGAIINQVSATGVNTASVYAKAGTLDFLLFYINYNSGTDTYIYFDLSTGSVGTTISAIDANIQQVGATGWYRCDVSFNCPSTLFDIRIFPSLADNNSGGTGSIYIQDAQLELGLVATPYIETTTTTGKAGILEDTPRFDYLGATCPSLLLEPSRTNLLEQSEYFGDSYWTKTNSIVSPNQTISPDGTLNANKYTLNATSARSIISTGVLSVGTVYTTSVFVKYDSVKYFYISNAGAGAYRIVFDIENGTIVSNGSSVTSSKIESYGNGWYRCSAVFTAAYTTLYFKLSPNLNSATFTNTTDFGYIWGAQVEASATYETSYIPTYGVSQTRAVDDCEQTSATSLIGQSEGTMFLDFVANDADALQIIYQVRTTGNVNLGQVDFRIQSGNLRALGNDGGSPQYNISAGAVVVGTRYKCAVRYATNDVAFYVNGVLKGTDTNASFGSSSLNQITFNENASLYYPSVNLKQALLFKTPLSNLDLAILTGATTYNTFAAMALALNYTVYE